MLMAIVPKKTRKRQIMASLNRNLPGFGMDIDSFNKILNKVIEDMKDEDNLE